MEAGRKDLSFQRRRRHRGTLQLLDHAVERVQVGASRTGRTNSLPRGQESRQGFRRDWLDLLAKGGQ